MPDRRLEADRVAPPVHLRLTLSGLVCLGGGLLLLLIGAAQGGPALALIGGFALALLAWAAILARRNLRGLRYRRRLTDLAMAGEPLHLDMLLETESDQIACFVDVQDEAAGNGCFWEPRPLLVATRQPAAWHLSAVMPGRGAATSWPVQLLRRGDFERFRYRLESRHPFGLWRATVDGEYATPITVYPTEAPAYQMVSEAAASGAAPAASAPQRATGHGEFRGLREFQQGDMLRQVAWRATARLGQPVVKEFDPELPGRYLLALHTWMPANHMLPIDDFEHGLEQITGFVIALADEARPFSIMAPWIDGEPLLVETDGEGLDAVLRSLATAPLRRQTSLQRLQQTLLTEMTADTIGWVVGPAPVAAWEAQLPEVSGRLIALAYGDRRGTEEVAP